MSLNPPETLADVEAYMEAVYKQRSGHLHVA